VQKTFSVSVEPLVAVANVGPVPEPKWQMRLQFLGAVAVLV
jgi:hypothetical protein